MRALREHTRHIEADLQAEYGIDVRDLYRPRGGTSRLTWRRLFVLLDGLPGNSLYKTAVRDAIPDDELEAMAARPTEGHGRLSRSDMLLMVAIDRLGHIGYRLGAYKQPPKPLPRPGVGGRKKLSDAGRAYLQKLIANHGATERPMVPMDGPTIPQQPS